MQGTHWSIARTDDTREVTPSGIGWELFWNYIVAKQKFQPDFFLYENNKSAAPAIKAQISAELGVPIWENNAALVSAQNRERFYCFNWMVKQPEDRGILLRDILLDDAGSTGYKIKDLSENELIYMLKQVGDQTVPVGEEKRREEKRREEKAAQSLRSRALVWRLET